MCYHNFGKVAFGCRLWLDEMIHLVKTYIFKYIHLNRRLIYEMTSYYKRIYIEEKY